ncbi:MAG: hypothetical protein ACOCVK_01550, partial [bacterium]
ECGHHYARSMASWALIPALSGFRCDLAAGTVEFDPPEAALARGTATPGGSGSAAAGEFRCFFSTGRSWGVYRQSPRADGSLERSVEVRGGEAVPGWSPEGTD